MGFLPGNSGAFFILTTKTNFHLNNYFFCTPNQVVEKAMHGFRVTFRFRELDSGLRRNDER